MGLIVSSKPVGVLGAGQFGTVVANLLAEKKCVLLYTRSQEKADQINDRRENLGYRLHKRIQATSSLEELITSCDILFPIVPSGTFLKLIEQMSPHLESTHTLIHGIKGFVLRDESKISEKKHFSRDDILTISEIIREKTSVIRIGCISGPNIAYEIAQRLPAATIIASRYEEVVHKGQKLLKSSRFLVYGSRDIIGVELCGALKNIIAIAAGLFDSLDLGNNAKAFLISRSMVDIVQIGRILGGRSDTFLGLAGIGDIITSCFSPIGRNFKVGQLLAKKKSISQILSEVRETAEGIRTIEIVVKLAHHYKIRCLVAEILHKIIHKEVSIQRARRMLMKLPFSYDTHNFLSK